MIDVLHTEQLVVEDLAGRAYRVGLGADSDVIADRVSASRGDPVLVRTDRLEVGGRTVAELIATLPRGARRVYVTGILMLHGGVDELPAVAGWMKRIEVTGGETWLRAACVSDLAWLAHSVIERGSLALWAEYGLGAGAPAVGLAEEPGRAFTIRLPGLPSLAGLLVEVGDEIVAGQPIARFVDDAALERARRVLVLAEAALTRSEELAASEQEQWATTVQRAKDELERVRRLVAAGARLASEAIEAVWRLEHATRRQWDGLTRWTSERARLLILVKVARSGVVRAEQELGLVVEAQWVRSGVAGALAKVSVNTGARGHLEIELAVLAVSRSEGRSKGKLWHP